MRRCFGILSHFVVCQVSPEADVACINNHAYKRFLNVCKDRLRLESDLFLLPVFDMFLEVYFVLALRYP